ncbi:uncharacterized protein METZ01_LOCUS200205, partial [marine metagenome]
NASNMVYAYRVVIVASGGVPGYHTPRITPIGIAWLLNR